MNETRPARIVVDRAATEAEGPELLAPDRALIEPPKRGNTTFRVGLALAVLLHLTPFLATALGVVSLMPVRRMGELDGDPEGISVEVVEEAALASLSTPPSPPAPPPAPPQVQMPALPQPPPPQQQAALSPTPPQIRGTTPPEPQPEAATPEKQPIERPPDGLSELPAEKQPPPKLPPEKAPAKTTAEPTDILKEMRELFAPDPQPKSRPPAPSQQASQQTPSHDAAPSVLDQPMEFRANSSSVARPVDATRSGENDEFGRGVIRALRQTMPPPLGLRSRVTIKFLLSAAGQVVEMRLVASSGYPLVDQGVLFAAQNSNFPPPPRGSKVADRIFLVTYIYE